jgi:NADH dehydrogenase
MPLIGGRTKFQPVYVGDVAAAIAAACDGQAAPGTTYELGGPEVQTFRKLLDRTQEWTGRDRPYLPVPFWLASLGALLTSPLPAGLRPLTGDQVRMLRRNNVVSEMAEREGRTLRGLGVDTPCTMDSIVPTYLEQFKPKGQYSHYRG